MGRRPLDRIRVDLVANPSGATTGLSRYARDLQTALSARSVEVGIVRSVRPPLPAWLTGMARSRGLDFEQFFTTYPVAMPRAPLGGILHLTSQNQASGLALRCTIRRTVVTVHDIITLMHRGKPELTGYMKPYDKLFDNAMGSGLKRASALIASSAHTRNDILACLGYPSSQVHVVYIGVDRDLFQPVPVPEAFCARHNLQRGAPSILYVGSEDPRKNLHRLIDAFAAIAARWPQVRLLKVGAARFAAERKQLVDHIARLNLTGRVTFFDHVSDKELAYFYSIATVFVLPSLYEGFGLPALEAMACGTPVVASNASSLPEVVGEAALLADPYDVAAMAAAIERVLADDGTVRAALRQRGLERADQFTWTRAANQILQVYQHVLEQPGAR